ncbi:MAG: cytochrome C, partial [Geobacteraceae bacterium]|nr:cytochrome C [Geobacteraceae bacterium]
MNAYTRIIIPLILFFILLPSSALPSDLENKKCINCHTSESIKNSSNNRLFIDPLKFSATSHSIVGCRSCHDRVSPGHPSDGHLPPRAACQDCHGPVFEEYSKSLHGAKAGCSDCHNPHEVRLPEFLSGEEINRKCAKCHDTRKTILTHSKWLPQAELHIDALPCITCHTGSTGYVITMYIQSRLKGSGDGFTVSSHEELSRLLDGEDVSRLIDTNGDRSISLQEIRDFNHKLRSRGMRLWGMMTPEVVTHSYQILENRWDCSFCHASGPKAMQKSFVAFPVKTGGFARV